ncbi:MAG: DNA primase [Saccharofermentanales bacterium]
MGLISRQSIDKVIEANDIVNVVSSYVRLEKKSSLNHFGLCPFHEEKTPSFSVSPGKQIFYCFGCQKGGNVIKFIQEIENLSYPEAIRFLADRAGLVIEETEDADWKERFEGQNQAYEALREAARFFYSYLEGPKGSEARAYLKKRGIDRSLYRKYGLGFSPHEADVLSRALKEKGIGQQALLDSGLVRKSSGPGTYDFFRGRLMFPIIDVSGRVLAFGGRAITDQGPKYINSSETLVYHKGKYLFGMPQAVKSSSKVWLLVEGYMDVLALAKAGIDWAVAPLGTALTSFQAQAIRRYVDQMHILMDGDRAGREASLRAGQLLEKAGVAVSHIFLAGAKDPDDYYNQFGCERLTAALKVTLDRTSYGQALLDYDYRTGREMDESEYRNQLLDLLAREPDGTKREIYGGRVAKDLQISHRAVTEEIERRRGLLDKEGTGRQQNHPPLAGPGGKARRQAPDRVTELEIIVLVMIANSNRLAANQLSAGALKAGQYALSDQVRDFLASDAVGSPLADHDFRAGYMRKIAGQALEDAKEGRLTLAGLHSIVDGALDNRGQEEEEPKEGALPESDRIHSLIQKSFQEMAASDLPPSDQERVYRQKLSQLRQLNWRREAARLNRLARKMEIEGAAQEAAQYYTKAAGLTTAADAFRMMTQGDN